MKYAKPLIAVALVAAFSAGTAAAQDSDAPSFADLAKGKKFITRSDLPKDNEALKTLRAHFGDADTNHDGKLDQGEYEAQIHKPSPSEQR